MQSFKLKFAVLFIFSMFHGESLFAQTCCSAGAPISTSLDIANSDSTSFGVQIEYLYNSVNWLVAENKILKNDPRKRFGQSLMLKLDYNLNRNFSFSMLLPYVSQQRETTSQKEQATGFGDLTILGQYVFRKKHENNILNTTSKGIAGMSLGVKLPTGSKFLQDERGIVLSPDMQSGTGTVDFIARGFYQKSAFLNPNLTSLNSVTFKFNTLNKHFGDEAKLAGRQFKFGNELILKSHYYFTSVIGALFFTPDLGLQFRNIQANEEQGMEASNSGGQWLSVPLGMGFLVNHKSNIRFFGEIPIWQNLNGTQITSNYRVGIQFRYLINS